MPAITPSQLIQFALAAYLAVDFSKYIRKGTLARHYSIFKGHDWKKWAKVLGACLLHLTILIFFISWLMETKNPILNLTWLKFIEMPGEHNTGTNMVAGGIKIPYFGLIFGLLLLINLPRLARREEEWFRRGTRDWKEAIPRSIKFGLLHLVVGVPIAAAIGLMGTGMFYTYRYFRGGVRDATLHHAVTNTIAILAVCYYTVAAG